MGAGVTNDEKDALRREGASDMTTERRIDFNSLEGVGIFTAETHGWIERHECKRRLHIHRYSAPVITRRPVFIHAIPEAGTAPVVVRTCARPGCGRERVRFIYTTEV